MDSPCSESHSHTVEVVSYVACSLFLVLMLLIMIEILLSRADHEQEHDYET
jgi:hypothetical protein